MKTIIATVGTSIFTNLSRNDSEFYNNYNDFIKSNLEHEKRNISEKVSNLFKSQEKINLSAEIKSIYKLGISKDDNIYFLSTDTNECYLAAQLLKKFFEGEVGCKVFIKRIEDLQVKDGNKFENFGVRNLVEEIIKIIREHEENINNEIILNPTGGFKGVVPYITILGMIYKREIKYIFETTESIISLPLLPLTFDFSLIKEYQEKFNSLEKNPMKKEEFYKGISNEKRKDFTPLIIEDSGEVMFSAIGYMLYEKYEQENKKSFLLMSMVAKKTYEKITDKNIKGKVNSLLEKITNKGLRQNSIHEKCDDVITNCYIMKEGSTKERIFFYLEDDIVKVCEIYTDHNKYELKLSQGVYKENYTEFSKFQVE